MTDQGKANYEGYYAAMPGAKPVPFEELPYAERPRWDGGAASVEASLVAEADGEWALTRLRRGGKRTVSGQSYTDEEIARACHAVFPALQDDAGDAHVSVPWASLDEAAREITRIGVRCALSGLGPREIHDAWVRSKAADGWTHGPVVDADAKTHPNMVSWERLPEAQRVKDRVFCAVVSAMRPGGDGLPDAIMAAVDEIIRQWLDRRTGTARAAAESEAVCQGIDRLHHLHLDDYGYTLTPAILSAVTTLARVGTGTLHPDPADDGETYGETYWDAYIGSLAASAEGHGIVRAFHELTQPDLREAVEAGAQAVAARARGEIAVAFTPAGYQGAAQHSYMARCDGFHEPGQCPVPDRLPDDEYRLTAAGKARADAEAGWAGARFGGGQ